MSAEEAVDEQPAEVPVPVYTAPAWIAEEEFKPKLWVKKLFDDGTELSPIICPKDVSDAELIRKGEQHLRILPGININMQGQLAMLDQLGAMWAEIGACLPWPKQERDSELRFYYENPSYSYFDAMSLAAMLQRLKPKRILAFVDEFQYACFMDILERLQLGAVCKFIEPDPHRLENYAPLPEDSPHVIICSTLKTLERQHFDQLEAGDVLFVDTTHVAKAGSDVCRLFGQVLPSLAPYVWVQIHDVFWPFEYPEGWLREGRSWNELYVLRAWLQFNGAVEIKLLLNYLWLFYESDCVRNFPDSKLNPGGALWIMRK